MRKLLIAGALALAAVLGLPSAAFAAGVTEIITDPPVQGTSPLGLVVVADTVWGTGGVVKPPPKPALGGCSQRNLFARGNQVVFRVWGVDAKHSGVALTDQNVQSAYVEIPGVTPNVTLTYGSHGTAPNKHAFWTAPWVVPDTYPLGVVPFRIVMVTKPFVTLEKVNVNTKTKGKANNNAKNVPYVFRGTYAGKGKVAVEHGNSWVRKAKLIGKKVAFNLNKARLDVADTNGDGKRDLSDVNIGDKVVVEARLPRTSHGPQPFVASRLVEAWKAVTEPGQTGYFTQANFGATSQMTITP